ncbi:hypothetical protein ACFE04_012258 [Oxalis oulophora]
MLLRSKEPDIIEVRGGKVVLGIFPRKRVPQNVTSSILVKLNKLFHDVYIKNKEASMKNISSFKRSTRLKDKKNNVFYNAHSSRPPLYKGMARTYFERKKMIL